jgi:transcription elongation factor GreA
VAPGKVVTVRFVDFGDEETFLLGSREEAAHASVEVYSPTSPLGQSVLGARIGDTVSYALANGKQVTVEIIAAQPYTG